MVTRNWAPQMRNVALLAAITENSEAFFGREDGADWSALLKPSQGARIEGRWTDHLRCLCGARAESAAEFFRDTAWRRCIVHMCSAVSNEILRSAPFDRCVCWPIEKSLIHPD
jgi:hypothetical protein